MTKKFMTTKTFQQVLFGISFLLVACQSAEEKSVVDIVGPISFPTKKRIYCVLRSPHVDKDTREQFEIRRYKKIIEVYAQSNDITTSLLKLELSPGVFTQVGIAKA